MTQQPFQGQYGGTPVAPKQELRPLGLLLILVGAVLALVSLTLRWNPSHTFADQDLSAFAHASAMQNDPAWTTSGVMLTIGLVLAIVSIVISLVIALVCTFSPSQPRAFSGVLLGFAVFGFLVGMTVLIANLALEGDEPTKPAVWIFAAAFIPIVAGAAGILSKKF